VLLAFDLDKTLVTDDFRLPGDIVDAIGAARDAGHHVTVLTGRPLVAARDYLEQLAIDLPHSVNHGSTILDGDGSLIARKHLDPADVATLLNSRLPDTGLEFSCVVHETIYVRDPAHERWTFAHAQGRVVSRYSSDLVLDADKLVFHSNGQSQRLEAELTTSHPHLLRYVWGDGYFEIVPTDGDKGSALRLIAERLGVARRDVVAFGDGQNDLTMIKWAGRSVAVGDDVFPDVLAAAHEHIASPEMGGVARWIEENVLDRR
jgi:Cof subfamily protein (haloacid dehalogenase superfamily)